jgi:hypothetical protein
MWISFLASNIVDECEAQTMESHTPKPGNNTRVIHDGRIVSSCRSVA